MAAAAMRAEAARTRPPLRCGPGLAPPWGLPPGPAGSLRFGPVRYLVMNRGLGRGVGRLRPCRALGARPSPPLPAVTMGAVLPPCRAPCGPPGPLLPPLLGAAPWAVARLLPLPASNSRAAAVRGSCRSPGPPVPPCPTSLHAGRGLSLRPPARRAPEQSAACRYRVGVSDGIAGSISLKKITVCIHGMIRFAATMSLLWGKLLVLITPFF